MAVAIEFWLRNFKIKENVRPLCTRHNPQWNGDATLKLPVCAAYY